MKFFVHLCLSPLTKVIEQQQKKTMRDIAVELKIPLSCLHDWMTKYREFENEPISIEERPLKLEQQLRAFRWEMNRFFGIKSVIKRQTVLESCDF